MVVRSPDAFAEAVASHPFDDPRLEPTAVGRAAESLARAGLLLVGEPHGVRETPSVLYRLAVALGTRALALEWSCEEMDEPAQQSLQSGSIDFDALWTLPASAEFFCGDGRITAGHFALLARLAAEGRLDQVIAYDRLDPESPVDWHTRDRDMAERILSTWEPRAPLLVLTGAFHARLDERGTLAWRLAGARPGLAPAMLAYSRGTCWSRGETHDVSGPMPDAPITFRLPEASPAVVPGVPAPASQTS